jgi:hypothetical protein
MTKFGSPSVKYVSLGRRVSAIFNPCSPYNTDRHDITEILLKVALNNITLTLIT